MKEIVKELKNAKIISIIGKVGTGKTTLATNIIKNFITDSEGKRNVVIYSFESFSVVLISLISQITSHKLNIFINKTDFEKDKNIKEMMKEKTSSGLFYLYEGGLTIKKLKLEIDNLSEKLKKHEKQIDLIFIDYLQLTYPLNLSVDTNFNKIAEENIKKLKDIAENYNIPIILVMMLSDNKKKENEQRKIIHESSDIIIEL